MRFLQYIIYSIFFIILIYIISKKNTFNRDLGRRDYNFNYKYQTETFNIILDKSKFEKKILPENNRWLNFVDAAYVIGLGDNWINFKKQAEYQDLEDITHYYTAPIFKDIKQKFIVSSKNYNLIGCHISHVLCCEDALKNNYKNIIIMEDDCFFTKYISNNEINKLVELKNKYKPKYINLSPHPKQRNLFCNQSKLDLKKIPSYVTHFIYISKEGMKHILKTKYEEPSKPFRMSGTGKNFIDRDWFGADDFWYSFSNEYALSVPDKNYWAIQYVHKNSTRNRN